MAHFPRLRWLRGPAPAVFAARLSEHAPVSLTKDKRDDYSDFISMGYEKYRGEFCAHSSGL
jgi:hypothetical protein